MLWLHWQSICHWHTLHPVLSFPEWQLLHCDCPSNSKIWHSSVHGKITWISKYDETRHAAVTFCAVLWYLFTDFSCPVVYAFVTNRHYFLLQHIHCISHTHVVFSSPHRFHCGIPYMYLVRGFLCPVTLQLQHTTAPYCKLFRTITNLPPHYATCTAKFPINMHLRKPCKW